MKYKVTARPVVDGKATFVVEWGDERVEVILEGFGTGKLMLPAQYFGDPGLPIDAITALMKKAEEVDRVV